MWGMMTPVGWQVTLCDLIRQVMLHSFAMGSHKYLYTTFTIFETMILLSTFDNAVKSEADIFKIPFKMSHSFERHFFIKGLSCHTDMTSEPSSAVQIFEMANRIVTSVFDSIRNEHNYSKFLNTYRHQFLTYLTEWRRFFTLTTNKINKHGVVCVVSVV